MPQQVSRAIALLFGNPSSPSMRTSFECPLKRKLNFGRLMRVEQSFGLACMHSWARSTERREEEDGDSALLYPAQMGLTNFRLGTDHTQGNQLHCSIVRGLVVLNLNFQPNPTKEKLYSVATRHPCTFSTKIFPSLDLAEN